MIVKLEGSKELIEAINSLAHALNNLSASLNLEVEKGVEQEIARRAEEKEEDTVSLDDVRAKLAALAQAGKQEEVKALIASFGASKLTEIPAERYREVMQKASEIA